MLGEAKVFDDAQSSIISAILVNRTNDGFEGGSNHLRRNYRAGVAVHKSVDFVQVASLGKAIVA